MSAENLALWHLVCTTDMAHTKQVTIPYKHTDINATYMFKCATEAFGPLGVGWGYTLGEPVFLASKTDALGLVMVRVELWHAFGGERSGPITVFGCKPMEYDTSTGKHMLDDEAVKKATTDGIKKALSMLGVCADVFMGERDGGKPASQPRAAKPANKPASPSAAKPSESGDAPECEKCGAIMKLRTVGKEGKNKGREFFGCPTKVGEDWCEGFLWASDWETRKAKRAAAAQDTDPENDDGGDKLADEDIPF